MHPSVVLFHFNSHCYIRHFNVCSSVTHINLSSICISIHCLGIAVWLTPLDWNSIAISYVIAFPSANSMKIPAVIIIHHAVCNLLHNNILSIKLLACFVVKTRLATRES